MKALIFIIFVFITISVIAQSEKIKRPKVETITDHYLDSLLSDTVSLNKILNEVKNPSQRVLIALEFINSIKEQFGQGKVKYSAELSLACYLESKGMEKTKVFSHYINSKKYYYPTSRDLIAKNYINDSLDSQLECITGGSPSINLKVGPGDKLDKSIIKMSKNFNSISGILAFLASPAHAFSIFAWDNSHIGIYFGTDNLVILTGTDKIAKNHGLCKLPSKTSKLITDHNYAKFIHESSQYLVYKALSRIPLIKSDYEFLNYLKIKMEH